MNESAPLRRELARICKAVVIESPALFHFAGRRVEVRPAPAPPDSRIAPEVAPEVAELQGLLYQHGYAHRLNGRLREMPTPPATDPAFIAALVAANAGRERYLAGWRVETVEPSGRALASRNGKLRSFQPGQYGPLAGTGAPIAPGASIWAFLAKGALDYQPGFYIVFGESLADPQDTHQGMIRLYFNVRSTGAPPLIAGLSRDLNRFEVPFTFKTLVQPEHYASRFDSSVLFTHRRFFPIVAQILAGLVPMLGSELGPETPLFTKRLAPGVGLAEDPGNGDSFGRHRCRLVSEALWSAFHAGVTTEAGRLAEVAASFDRQGLSLEKPFLNPRSIDRYDLPTLETAP
jgi:hypothetical protein